jgi:predicted MFS family arabinose efflux permease
MNDHEPSASGVASWVSVSDWARSSGECSPIQSAGALCSGSTFLSGSWQYSSSPWSCQNREPLELGGWISSAIVGQLLVIAALATLTYAIIDAPSAGWESVRTAGLFVVATVVVGIFLKYESDRVEPLIEIGIFHSVRFSGGVVIAACAFAGFSAFLFLSPLYLEEVRGLTPMSVGLSLIPMAVATTVAAPLSGRIVANRGPRLPLMASGTSLCIGAILLTQLAARTSLVVVLLSFLAFGVGFGLVNAPISSIAVSAIALERAGTGAAIASTSRQIGASLGVAVVGSVVAGGAEKDLSLATHPAWWIIAGCAGAVILIGWFIGD